MLEGFDSAGIVLFVDIDKTQQVVRLDAGGILLKFFLYFCFGLIEKMLLDVMYEVPGADDILSVKITKGVVQGGSKPIIRRKQDQAAA